MDGAIAARHDRRQFTRVAAAALALAAVGPARPGRASTGQATPAPATDGPGLPLAEAAPGMEPAAVWEIFEQLTRIPRPSHHEEQVSDWLAARATAAGFETLADGAGNVIVRKPATAGMDDRPGVILQAHMDMVAQKAPGSSHDFLADPIAAVVRDGWVTADETTLGADDGIGVALILALLEDGDLRHGPLEAVFTVNEEDGFGGVDTIDPAALRGSILINVDSEEDWIFTIGSAGGLTSDASGDWTPEPVPAGMTGLTVAVGGGRGGHSGMEIDSGRGNANKLLVRLLDGAREEFGARLAAIAGGDRYNAIPMQASAVVAVPAARAEAFAARVQEFAAALAVEYAAGDGALTASASEAPAPALVMPEADQDRVIAALHAAPNGVIRMSDTLPGMVQTSTNLGILSLGDGAWTAGFYVRSAVDSERDEVSAEIAAVMRLAGAEYITHNPFSGWTPRPGSQILALMSGAYRELFGEEPEIATVHAGLETSVFGAKLPGLDMISVGPTLEGVHAPGERLKIASVPKEYALLAATLAAIPPGQN